MKYFVLVLSLALSVFSCKKVDELTQFTIESDSESVIESVIGINLSIDLPTPIITTHIEQEMEENNSHKDLIEYAYLTKLHLAINSPASADFNFLNDIEIYISASGLPKQKIAYQNTIPETDLKELELSIVPEVDLTNYIKSDTYVLNIEVKTDGISLQDVTIGIHSEVFVDAKILGI